jgi:hypothetical protein
MDWMRCGNVNTAWKYSTASSSARRSSSHCARVNDWHFGQWWSRQLLNGMRWWPQDARLARGRRRRVRCPTATGRSHWRVSGNEIGSADDSWGSLAAAYLQNRFAINRAFPSACHFGFSLRSVRQKKLTVIELPPCKRLICDSNGFGLECASTLVAQSSQPSPTTNACAADTTSRRENSCGLLKTSPDRTL